MTQQANVKTVAGVSAVLAGFLAVVGAVQAFAPQMPLAGGAQSTASSGASAVSASPSRTPAGRPSVVSPSPSLSTPTAQPSPRDVDVPPLVAPSESEEAPYRQPVVRRGVHQGSFCTPSGARGVTVAGTPMVCRTSATDERLRWRRAA